jgi:O-antigen/teichoic acid export membrane protein
VSLFRSVTRWTIIVTLPIFLWIIVGGEATLALFGPEFVRGYEAVVWMAAGFMLATSMGPVGVALAMTGYQKWNVYNAIALAIITVALNVLLVPSMGVAGAGLAAGAGQALVKIARLIQVRYLLKINPYDRSSLKVAVTVAVSLVLAFLSRRYIDMPPGLITSVAVMVASVVVVAALTIAMGVTQEDRMVLSTVLRKIRRARGGA